MRRFTLFLVPLLLLSAGCAGTALRPGDTQQQEVQALKARILELQREAAMNQVEMAQLRQQVAELEAGRPRGSGISGAAASTARPAAPAPVTARPSSAGTTSGSAPKTTATTTVAPPSRPAAPPPVTAPAPRREPAPAIAETETEIEEVDIDLPPSETQPPPPPRRAPPTATTTTRPAPTPAAPVTPAPRPAAPAAPPPTPAPAPVNPPAQSPAPAPAQDNNEAVPETLSPGNQVLYDRGYTLYYQGHYVDAEASFQRFLQANPTSELADNAQYWIGECRYARNDVKGALSAFRETIERFPKGNKVSDAMLKLGSAWSRWATSKEPGRPTARWAAASRAPPPRPQPTSGARSCRNKL